MVTYARKVPGGREHHIVQGEATACGLQVKGESGWAVWPVQLASRVAAAPTCERCREVVVPRDRWCPICQGAKSPSEDVCVGCGVTQKHQKVYGGGL